VKSTPCAAPDPALPPARAAEDERTAHRDERADDPADDVEPGTRRQGKSPRTLNAMLTAGFRWAPEALPMNMMIAITISNHPAARRDEHEEEGVVQLREPAAPLLVRILEVGERLEEALFLLREEARQSHPYGFRRVCHRATTPARPERHTVPNG
jgi:hypothetical protein